VDNGLSLCVFENFWICDVLSYSKCDLDSQSWSPPHHRGVQPPIIADSVADPNMKVEV